MASKCNRQTCFKYKGSNVKKYQLVLIEILLVRGSAKFEGGVIKKVEIINGI